MPVVIQKLNRHLRRKGRKKNNIKIIPTLILPGFHGHSTKQLFEPQTLRGCKVKPTAVVIHIIVFEHLGLGFRPSRKPYPMDGLGFKAMFPALHCRSSQPKVLLQLLTNFPIHKALYIQPPNSKLSSGQIMSDIVDIAPATTGWHAISDVVAI